MLAYVIPTRNRPAQLAQTLSRLAAMPRHHAQIIVVDNASSIPPSLPMQLANGLGIELVLNSTNEGAAARNRAAHVADPCCEWLVMLDDDSAPLSDNITGVLLDQPPDVLAVAAEVFLEQGGRESGGLPEVFIGCGAAIRRQAFLDAGGYDPAFNYYAEEYDLAAKLLLAGGRVALDRRFRVQHRKAVVGRNTNLILRRLVRNNAWVMQRYAPDAVRAEEINRVRSRYATIAAKEQALPGYLAGEVEWRATSRAQRRSPMNAELFDRFTGLTEARSSLQSVYARHVFGSACLIDVGKNDHVILHALDEMGVSIVENPSEAEVLVVGTMSPGPLLDSWERRVAGLCGIPGTNDCAGIRVISAWNALTPQQAMDFPAAKAA